MPKITVRSPITILITLEGLSTSALGCYGCSWNQTPAIDALAATGVVWDRWTSPVDFPGGLINRWLVDSQDVIKRFDKQGDAVFVTDDQDLELSEGAFGFSTIMRLKHDARGTAAETIEDSALAQTFAAAIDCIESKTSFVWIHSSALLYHWDAPDLQEPESDVSQEPVEDQDAESELDPGEPFCLPDTTRPPNLKLSIEDDPDLLFAWMTRYAGQVRLLDQMIEFLGDEIHRRRPTILLAGASGFSLGENGYVGHHLGPLRSPDIRLPMLVSSSGPVRAGSLQSATSLPSVLERIVGRKTLITPSEWCQSDDAPSSSVLTDSDRSTRAVTTPTWFYINEKDDGGSEVERLFLKPDDVNDINDVARLRRDVLDDLAGE